GTIKRACAEAVAADVIENISCSSRPPQSQFSPDTVEDRPVTTVIMPDPCCQDKCDCASGGCNDTCTCKGCRCEPCTKCTEGCKCANKEECDKNCSKPCKCCP
ncbi:unnamed protein product, partial [Meganyctiphanes norvegica]